MIIGKLQEMIDDHRPGLALGVIDLALHVRFVVLGGHDLTPQVRAPCGRMVRDEPTASRQGPPTPHFPYFGPQKSKVSPRARSDLYLVLWDFLVVGAPGLEPESAALSELSVAGFGGIEPATQ